MICELIISKFMCKWEKTFQVNMYFIHSATIYQRFTINSVTGNFDLLKFDAKNIKAYVLCSNVLVLIVFPYVLTFQTLHQHVFCLAVLFGFFRFCICS